MPLLINIGMLASCRPEGLQGDIHPIRNAALAWQGARIVWLGPESELPESFRGEPRVDAKGRLVIPGLIDAHTHLAFGGWRAHDFVGRIQGETYLEIAGRGGGIHHTVDMTRRLSEEELFLRARGFLQQMVDLGVSTVECKSGYGLVPEEEMKLLRVYRRLQEEQPARVVPTLLAHMVPEEYRGRRQDYVDLWCTDLIPAVAEAGLAEFCDIFVEETAFTVAEARAILEAARANGLGVKVHADQFGDRSGAALAAEFGAVSAEHLEFAREEGIRALAAAGTVAVSLPLASLYLRQPPLQARRFIECGVPVAVATDFNPGSAPSWHLPLAMTLACLLQQMTPGEVLKATTIQAARAVGRQAEIGSLEPGKLADFAVIDAPDVDHWLYHFRPNSCIGTYINGTQATS
jgi:imidazolonepropionase